jgi:hypothetical protein
MNNDDQRHAFLFEYGAYIVYLVFLMGLFLNGTVAVLHFINGRWLFGIWAIFSIILLPKAALGLICLLGQKSIVCMNMSFIIGKIFPSTIQKYRYAFFGSQVLKGFLREIIWLVLSFVPILVFLSQD